MQKQYRQILVHGLAMVLVGLIWGLVIPHTPFPRLALGAHIQLTSNGSLIALIGIVLLAVPHSVGPKSIVIMVVTSWLTWTMALSEVANSWWGTNQLLAQAAAQAGAKGGAAWQEAIVKLTHISSGLALILACALLVVGCAKGREQG